MAKQLASAISSGFAKPELLSDSVSTKRLAGLLAAVGDVALILSGDGVILDVAATDADLAGQGLDDWPGSAWIDTVTVESRPKVREMIAEAPAGDGRWRQVNHPAAGGDIPVRYLVMALGDDRLVAIGRDMRGAAAMQQRLLQTQQSLERDYIRLRQAETRYRLLFELAIEPVLIVDAESRRIREANPAAHRLLNAAEGSLIGTLVSAVVDARHRDDFIAYLGAAEAADDRPPITLRLAERRGSAQVSARLFRQGRAPLLLVRIAAPIDADDSHRHDAALAEVIDRMPDAFVLVDRELTVLAANAAFVELAEMPSVDRVVGSPLGVWLGRPGIDLELMQSQLREHDAVRNVATIVRGAAGAREEVEVSGVVAPTREGECYGFTIRNVSRRLRDEAAAPGELPRSVEQLTDLVGRMSLKEIVRESTDLIERLCIEAALAHTSDNRASAAEILGVSRQSLYSKLHRHGLGNLVSGDE